jgi:SAM-dependent methyltransferase
MLRTYDVDPAMVERTCSRAREAGVDNVVCFERDVFLDGFGLEPDSIDACLLFNILHGEEPARLLKEADRVIRPSGLVLVIHWRSDVETPRGPNPDIRPTPSQIIEWAAETNHLTPDGPVVDLPPWHYGVRLRKESFNG